MQPCRDRAAGCEHRYDHAPTGSPTVSAVNATNPPAPNGAGKAPAGTLGNITITRNQHTYPGWSVPGQLSNFTKAALGPGTINGDQMIWMNQAIDTALAKFLELLAHIHI